MGTQHSNRFAFGTSTLRAERKVERMRRVTIRQATPHPPSFTHSSSPATPGSRHVPRPASGRLLAPSTPSSPGFNLALERFHIGTPGLRRRETPLEQNVRVNQNGKKASKLSDPFRAPRPPLAPAMSTPRTREPFISPSIPSSSTNSSSWRSRHPQRTSSAKTRLDFSAEATPPARQSPLLSMRSPRQANDPMSCKLDLLKTCIKDLMREHKWHEVMAKINEALSLKPACSELRLQHARVQHKLFLADMDERSHTFAEQVQQRRQQRRLQRLQEDECDTAPTPRKHRSRVRTHYEILHVDAHASSDQIKKAYRTLVRLHHPDKTHGSSGEEIKCITQAHRVLSDPKERAAYDASIGTKKRRYFQQQQYSPPEFVDRTVTGE